MNVTIDKLVEEHSRVCQAAIEASCETCIEASASYFATKFANVDQYDKAKLEFMKTLREWYNLGMNNKLG